MDAARKYVEKGQTDRAIKEYLKIVQHDPKDVRVWLKIGDLYAKKGAKAEATETYLKVAKFYSEQGFYLKAVAVYKQILKLDPRMVEVNLKLAELYRQLGLLSDAMQHFERVAAFFHREGKTKEALATIRQLVDLDPDNVATRIKLAELYSKEEMTEEAIQEFRQACEYLRSHNRQDDFIKVAERLLWHDNTDMALNRELATLYLRRNDARRALQKLQVCFKADSRDVETLALLAQAFQALDQKSKTVSVLKELARVFTENGQQAQAQDVHRKILMFAPDDPDSREALGEPPSTRQAAIVPEPSDVVDEPAQVRSGFGNPTGSMPLVRDPHDEVEMEIEGYPGDENEEEDSFVADIAVDEESFQVGSEGVEANADEIVKILTETDVYVKYGLQQKAIDHLQRVFELDPNNVEARERLKDIYLGDGRDQDAVAELITLAQLVAPQDPERAEGYLSEAAEIDPESSVVRSTAGRLHLELGQGPEVEIVDDLSGQLEMSADDLGGGGNIAPVDDVEFDDVEFGDAGGDFDVGYDPEPPRAVAAPEFLEPELLDEDVGGSDFEFELDGYDASSRSPAPAEARPITQEVQLDQLEDERVLDDNVEELSFDEISDVAPAPDGTTELSMDDLEFAEPAELIEDEPAAELAHTFDDPQSLDAAPIELQPDVPSDQYAMELPGGVTEDSRVARAIEPRMGDPRMGEPRVADPMRAPLMTPPEHLPPDEEVFETVTVREPTHTQQTIGDDQGGTSLEDDLDEADFFVTQNLFDEARDILHGLLSRYPNHPLIVAKLQDIAAMEAGEPGGAPVDLQPEDINSDPIPDQRIEHELAAHDFIEPASRESRVKLEQAVDDEDADTHYDLGLAYKEMGLFDEAIKAFQKVVNVPGRGVECNMMIGLCHRDQGALAEAVQQFKSGLYVDGISDTQKLNLYYEIGIAYEAMDDPGEALYFFEMVLKKDASHRDVAERVAALKAATANGNGARHHKGGRTDDVEPAFGDAAGPTDDISRH
jgi:tetratricopeptide (TPR) repeat protein